MTSTHPVTVVGYLHVVIQKISVSNASSSEELIHGNISLGQIAKVSTTAKKSGSNWNEVFLIQVPKDPSRLAIFSMEGQKKLGQCRYDVYPFFGHEGATHTIQSQLYDDDNKTVGNIKMKLTYYSSRLGKLRIRIFGLQFPQPVVEQFKEAKVKVRIGIHAQTTAVRKLAEEFDETVDVLVLSPTMSLTFEVIHEKGIVGLYSIKNIEQGKVLQEQPKAYQVSLFNNDKAIGLIKYKIDWIKPKV